MGSTSNIQCRIQEMAYLLPEIAYFEFQLPTVFALPEVFVRCRRSGIIRRARKVTLSLSVADRARKRLGGQTAKDVVLIQD